MVGLLERCSPATANNRYRALQQFFRWLKVEELIVESPMADMKPPTVPDKPLPLLSDDHPGPAHLPRSLAFGGSPTCSAPPPQPLGFASL